MGLEIYNWVKTKYQKSWGIAFCSAMILGLFTHMYKITNTLLNHDAVTRTYLSQNMTMSGRWFLSVACGISSYFDLPWINGILALVYIALTSVVIVNMFKVENPIVICLISGLLSTFPSVTVTFFYGFTVDGYMLSMLLAALSAHFLSIFRGGWKKKRNIIVAVFLLCLSCAIYQAYVSFALVLSVGSFMIVLLENRIAKIEYMKWLGVQLLTYALALPLYYVIWKLCLLGMEITPTDYQGIDSVGISFGTILSAFSKTISTLVVWLLEGKKVTTLYGALNMMFLFFSLYTGIVVLYKSRIVKNRVSFCLFLGSVVTLPFAICIWYFTSPGVEYHLLMLQSIVVVYILILLLAEKWLLTKAKNLLGILVAVIVFNFMLQANIAYYQLQYCDRVTYMNVAEMVSRIHQLGYVDDYDLMIIGKIDKHELNSYKLLNDRMPLIGNMLDYNLFYSESVLNPYFNNYLGIEVNSISVEKRKVLLSDSQVAAMPCWPQKDSLQVIDDVVVIKLSDSYLKSEEN